MWQFLAAINGLATLVTGAWLASYPAESPLWLRSLCAGAGGGAALSIARYLAPKKRKTSYGSAGFATVAERKDLLFDSVGTLPRGAIILGKEGDYLIALTPPYTTQHGVIIGGSGTGKSFGFFLPNMAVSSEGAAEELKVSRIATDPKSELWHYTSGFHSHATRYAPTEPGQSAGFNWIPLCADARMASLCARTIVEAGETTKQEAPWPDLETAFLAALFSHTSTLPVPTPLTAYQLLTRSSPDDLMAQFVASSSWVAREQAVIFQQTHERMRGSITPVLAAKLQFMRDPRVARFTSSNFVAPDFGRLRLCAESVYFCVPEQDMALLRALTALFFTVLLDQLAHVVDLEKAVPVQLYLDEFANIGIIPNYETTISLARGRGLSIWHGLQSLSQLEARYGKPNAQTILTNCATKIALSGLDVETAHYFSRSLGEATASLRRPSWNRRRFALFASTISVSNQEHARLLMTPDEVRRMEEGQALVITGNRRPLLINKYHYKAAPKTASVASLGEAQSIGVAMDESSQCLIHEQASAKESSPPVFRLKLLGVKKTKRARRAHSTILQSDSDEHRILGDSYNESTKEKNKKPS